MRRLSYPLSIAVVAAILFAGVVFAQSQTFSRIVTGTLLVRNTSEMRGDVAMGDSLAIADDLTVASDTTMGGFIATTPGTTITVAYQGSITPLGSLVYLTSSAARGTRLIVTTTVPAGTLIRVVNVGAQTITLTDTAPLVMAGNFAMGAKDNITFYMDGDEWVELTRANN